MKNILAAVSAIGLIASTPAFAADADIQLGATVAAACGTGNHISGAGSASGWDQSDITVDLDDANGQFSGAEFTNRSFGNVWCNAPATVTIEVSALQGNNPVGTDTGSFTNRFDIEVTTDAGVYAGGGEDEVISTVGALSGVASISGNSGQAFETGLQRFGGADSIKVLPSTRSTGGNRRAVAGTYAGYVKFTATTN